MKYILLALLCVSVSACKSQEPSTPLEQEEQEQRMRQFLNDSSPRNTNQHSKVVPEFRKTFNTGSSSSEEKPAAPAPDTVEENW